MGWVLFRMLGGRLYLLGYVCAALIEFPTLPQLVASTAKTHRPGIGTQSREFY